MIQKILIQSRKQIEDLIRSKTTINPFETSWALISIWNTSELIHLFTRNLFRQIDCQEDLSIRFADLTLEEYEKIKEKKEYKLFNEIQAKQIIDFIDKINKLDIPILVIHCAAGISRSGAVGLFTCRYLGLDEIKFKEINKHILPNFYILKTLNEVSGINKEYISFWETKENKIIRDIMFNKTYNKTI